MKQKARTKARPGPGIVDRVIVAVDAFRRAGDGPDQLVGAVAGVALLP